MQLLPEFMNDSLVLVLFDKEVDSLTSLATERMLSTFFQIERGVCDISYEKYLQLVS